MKTQKIFAVSFAILAFLTVGRVRAEDFYKGRVLTIAVGSPAGGVYDISARLYGRHIANFIPGSPTVVVQNMPGAAGIRAANYLFNVAPKDGTFIALSLDNLLLNQFLTPGEVKFQADKFNWIGRGDRPTRVLYVWAESGIMTLDDARKREVLTGVTAPGTASEMYPSLANALLGTRFKLISGYDGAGGMNLALERGEIEAVGANSWVSLNVTKPEWLREGKVRNLFQTTLTRDRELADTPTLVELATTDESREVIQFEARSEEIGFYLMAPPSIPQDRVEILRTAFANMVASPAYIDEAKGLNMGTNWLSGRDLQKLAESEAATATNIVQKFKDAVSSR